ncbi:unnamed protein product [Brassicogethes aeneus]|uniref:Uncharacterized protein n=1 Tax=Brassicogethes aeneus TaxID=1431903 RepID=A0A9P0FHT8_BRAAE|nr:unnamed protein product [Brassicogethes aeneus]
MIMHNPRLGYLIAIIAISLIVTFYQIQFAKLQDKIETLERNIVRHDQQKLVLNNNVNDNDFVLIYNRVPKTGSTSFVGVTYDLCKVNKFHVLHVNITANSHILSLDNQFKFVKNVTNWKSIKPALYHGHFAFVDFSKFGVPKPLYINIIRKPLDRFISYYYFVRYGDNFRPYLIRRKHGNTVSFDECVSKSLPDCDPNNIWLQIPFFCGHSANCWKPGNKWALNEAKKNLVNNYLLVGVTEELNDFIDILEHTLPTVFNGSLHHYLNSNKSHLRQTVQKEMPSEKTIVKLRQSMALQMENEFYEFALDQFHFIKKQGKKRIQNLMYEKIKPKLI